MTENKDLEIYYVRYRYDDKHYYKHCPNKGYAVKICENPLSILKIKSVTFQGDKSSGIGRMEEFSKAKFDKIREKVIKELSNF